mgnify:CR=1 FL=1
MNGLRRAGLGILAAVFATAGCLKIAAPAEFAAQLAAFRLLPEGAVPTLALSLPVLEVILAAALLVSGRGRRAGLLGITLLLAGFLGALLWAWATDLAIDCGCFGSLEMPVPVAIVRNVVLLGISGLLLHREYKATPPQGPFPKKIAENAKISLQARP